MALETDFLEGDIRRNGEENGNEEEWAFASTNKLTRVPDAHHVTCAAPTVFRNRPITSVPFTNMTSQCAPVIIPSLDSVYHVRVGENISLSCLAIGVPPPDITWYDSMARPLSAKHHHYNATLTSVRLSVSHANRFECVANNSHGRSRLATVVKVYSDGIHLVVLGRTSSSIILTWNNSQSTLASTDYVITYGEQTPHVELKQVRLRQRMRDFTFSQLKPDTLYEFCLGYVSFLHEVHPLDCIKLHTQPSYHHQRHQVTSHAHRLVLVFSMTSLSIVILCLTSAACRSRKRYQHYGAMTCLCSDEQSRDRKWRTFEPCYHSIPLHELAANQDSEQTKHDTIVSTSSSMADLTHSLAASTQSLLPRSKS